MNYEKTLDLLTRDYEVMEKYFVEPLGLTHPLIINKETVYTTKRVAYRCKEENGYFFHLYIIVGISEKGNVYALIADTWYDHFVFVPMKGKAIWLDTGEEVNFTVKKSLKEKLYNLFK